MKTRRIDRFRKPSANNTAHNPASAAAASSTPAPSVTQVSVFRSPAARRLRVAGMTAGAAWGTFAGAGGSIGNPGDLARNTVAGALLGSLFLGTLGFFAGAASVAMGRTAAVKSATGAVRNFMKNKF